MTKVCRCCKQSLPLEAFHKKAMGAFGVDSLCKPCRKTKSAAKYQENKEEIKAKTNAYKQANRDAVRTRSKEYDKKNAEKIAQRKAKYRDDNAEHIAAQKKEYHSRPEVKARRSRYHVDKKKTDLQYRLKALLRARIANCIKNNTKKGSAVADLGCSIEQFKLYIESKWQPGMTWENHNLTGWHIDHIIPLSSFDLTNRQQFLKATHYTNLQPLWAKDNWKKNRFVK